MEHDRSGLNPHFELSDMFLSKDYWDFGLFWRRAVFSSDRDHRWGWRDRLTRLFSSVWPTVTEEDEAGISCATIFKCGSGARIGEAYFDKIVKDRPYQWEHELVQKRIVPLATYEQINHKIVAKQK